MKPWEIRRAIRLDRRKESPEEWRESLELYLANTPNHAGRSIIEAGLLQRKELMPLLRRFSKLELPADVLYYLVWTTGELEDREQIPWLIECLDSPRPWLPLAAAEALKKITGKDLGTDAEVWRAELGS
jgi:hypothetical protein